MAAVTHGDLDSSGVCVVRSSGAEMVDACRACHAGVIESLDRMLSLPGTLGAPSDRHFLPFATCRGDGGAPPPTHQRDFLLPFSPWVEEVLQIALRGTEAGAILVQALGRDAELDGLQAITSEPGTAAQDLHSDAAWGTPRTITVFLALHDISTRRWGPRGLCRKPMSPAASRGGAGCRRQGWVAIWESDAQRGLRCALATRSLWIRSHGTAQAQTEASRGARCSLRHSSIGVARAGCQPSARQD